MNQSKIKVFLIILAVILIVVILGVTYSAMKDKEKNPVPGKNPENTQVSTEITEDVMKSIDAPAGGEIAEPTQEVIESLTAPASKSDRDDAAPEPVSDEILDSLSAPSK